MTKAADQPSLALDTGPAIYLDALGYVEATSHVGGLVLPPAVVRELERKPNAWGARVPQLECTKLAVPDPGLVQIISAQRALDAGEAEVIALAAGSGGVLPVLDDRKAREYAEANGIVIRGTVGILIELHERGLAARSIEHDISSLRREGMRLGDALAASVVERVRRSELTVDPRLRRNRASRGRWPAHRHPPGRGGRDLGG